MEQKHKPQNLGKLRSRHTRMWDSNWLQMFNILWGSCWDHEEKLGIMFCLSWSCQWCLLLSLLLSTSLLQGNPSIPYYNTYALSSAFWTCIFGGSHRCSMFSDWKVAFTNISKEWWKKPTNLKQQVFWMELRWSLGHVISTCSPSTMRYLLSNSTSMA